MKNIFCFIAVVVWIQAVSAQELQAKFSIVSNNVSSQVDKKVFQTLQTALTNFLNNRKWTNDAYQPQEKIKCNFLLNIDKFAGNNTFQATLTIQAARPIYNTTYESPIINFQDPSVQFKY